MNNIITRPCNLEDDIVAIADLIVDTDDYIYPPMFRLAPQERYSFFADCFRDENSIFYYKNIFLALQEERIVGILVAFSGKCALCSDRTFSSYLCQKDIAYCDRHYFQVLFEEYEKKPSIVCISNVCIRRDVRNCGIGKQILQAFIGQHSGVLELDVLCDNPSAIHLYESCGFSILYAEDAFAFEVIPDFKSYRMRRNP